jgi:hypothetical protein
LRGDRCQEDAGDGDDPDEQIVRDGTELPSDGDQSDRPEREPKACALREFEQGALRFRAIGLCVHI